MIITYFGIVVFQLVFWVNIFQEVRMEHGRKDMLEFSYSALPTRHEVSIKLVPMLNLNPINAQNYKLFGISV